MNITHESALAAATVENYSYLRQKIYKLQYENKYKCLFIMAANYFLKHITKLHPGWVGQGGGG